MMTVEELYDLLEYLPRDMEVVFAYPYGDYIGSIVTGDVDSVEVETVEKSEYHRGWRVPEDRAADGETKTVVVIK
jgi:hypothetical protein